MNTYCVVMKDGQKIRCNADYFFLMYGNLIFGVLLSDENDKRVKKLVSAVQRDSWWTVDIEAEDNNSNG